MKIVLALDGHLDAAQERLWCGVALNIKEDYLVDNTVEEGFKVVVEVAGKVGDNNIIDACAAFVGGNVMKGGGEVVEVEGEH